MNNENFNDNLNNNSEKLNSDNSNNLNNHDNTNSINNQNNTNDILKNETININNNDDFNNDTFNSDDKNYTTFNTYTNPLTNNNVYSKGNNENISNNTSQQTNSYNNNSGGGYDTNNYAQQQSNNQMTQANNTNQQQIDTSVNYVYQDGNWHYSPPNNQPLPKNETKQKTSSGIKVLAVVMTIAFVVVTLGFGSYIAYDTGFFNQMFVEDGPDNGANNGNTNYASDQGLDLKDVPNDDDSGNADGILSSKEIAKIVKPAVVGIVCLEKNSYSYQPTSQGTGIIFREDGYIVTNSHVVRDGVLNGKYQVILSDKTEYDATLIGFDIKTDLAVVKIDAKGLPTAQFGNSDQVEVGEDVLAIGNPYSLEFAGTTTKGIISGVNTTINVGNSNYSMKTLQTDAAINPGNSGGALVNQFGQVIGINSAKIASEDVEGMGFAIPSNIAAPIVDNIVQYGYVKDRVRIGITYSSIPDYLAQLNEIPAGLRVIEVDQATDAYKKGVKPGDIIYKINNTEVKDYKSISEILETKKPGDTVKLSIFRVDENMKSSKVEITIKLEEDIPLKANAEE